jgi:dihydrodipicolinate reductase
VTQANPEPVSLTVDIAAAALQSAEVDVLVDYTSAAAVKENTLIAYEPGCMSSWARAG